MEGELQCAACHDRSVAGHRVGRGLALEAACLLLVTEVSARERADQQGALVLHAWRRGVCNHGFFHALLKPAGGFPVAEELFEHQGGGNAVQPMMR